MLLLTYKIVNGLAPAYLAELIQPYTASRSLRSSDKNLLVVPVTRLKTFGDRAFSKAAPKLWNNLPSDIRSTKTLSLFKSRLKTHLFAEAYKN